MKKMISISALLASIFLVSCGRGVVPPHFAAGGLSVSAQGEAQSAPDQIQITFSLGALRASAEEALASLEEKHKAVITALQSAGLQGEDLKMTDYHLTTERRWDEPSRSEVIVGFTSKKSFSLDVDFTKEMLTQVYNTLSSVPSDNKTFFSFNVNFGLKDPSALEQEALASAIAKVKADAKFIADSAGVKLAGIISITPDQSVDRPIVYKEMRSFPSLMLASADSAGAAPMNAQEIKVTRGVVIVWNLFGR